MEAKGEQPPIATSRRETCVWLCEAKPGIDTPAVYNIFRGREGVRHLSRTRWAASGKAGAAYRAATADALHARGSNNAV